MDAPTFWNLFGELWQTNPPHDFDYPTLHRMARLGLETSQPISDSNGSMTTGQTLDASARSGGSISRHSAPERLHTSCVQPLPGRRSGRILLKLPCIHWR